MDEAERKQISNAIKERKDREKGQLCAKALAFKGMVTHLLGQIAEQWTDATQLDEAMAVLDEMASQWKAQASGYKCSLYSHPCVDAVHTEARLRLQAMRRLQLKGKLW
jgi:hypothetical protein